MDPLQYLSMYLCLCRFDASEFVTCTHPPSMYSMMMVFNCNSYIEIEHNASAVGSTSLSVLSILRLSHQSMWNVTMKVVPWLLM